PYAGVEVRLRRLEDGATIEGPGLGELGVVDRYAFAGYYEAPGHARSALDDDGVFWTGDVFERDGDGDFHFLERDKDLIRRGGENVAAREVEDVLDRHPSVRESAVIGVDDDIYGQQPFAFLSLSESADEESVMTELRRRCEATLAPFKIPVAF